MNTPNPYSDLPIVALTGSIGSGKTKAAEILHNCGALCIDADQLARESVLPGTQGLAEIRSLFGEEVIHADDGTLNRKLLGEIIFQDSHKREQLEAILHPQIRRLLYQRLDDLQALSHPPALIIYVVPLFFESKFSYPEIQRVIVVYAPRETCLKRIVERDSCSIELAEAKYNSQIPIESKVEKADYIIENVTDLSDLEQQCRDLYPRILEDLNI